MIRFVDVFSKTDWIKLGILLVVGITCWVFVYQQYKDPIIPPDWQFSESDFAAFQ